MGMISTTDIADYRWADDHDYVATFNKIFFGTLKNISKYYMVPIHNIIICMDCSKRNIWRRDIFSEYKDNRIFVEHDPKAPNFGSMFEYVKEKIIPSLGDKGIVTIQHNRCEGDDIIAILTKYLLNENDDNIVNIIANDGDLKQLITNNRVKIITLEKDKIFDISNIDYKYEKFKKVLMGDKKDGVPSVHPRCGLKTAEKYWKNSDLLKEKLNESVDYVKQFKINQKMQLFDSIPNIINDEVVALYKEKLNG